MLKQIEGDGTPFLFFGEGQGLLLPRTGVLFSPQVGSNDTRK